MTSGAMRIVRVSIATSWLFVLLLGVANAAAQRPNALDKRVDAIAAHDLMTMPATALVDPERQHAAQRLVHYRLPGWFATIVIQVLVLAYFWQSGAGARLRDRLRSMTRNEALARFLFGAALGFIANLAALIPEFYLYRVDRVFGLNDLLLRTWAGDWLLNTLASMLLVGVTVVVVLALVDRTHQWYIYTLAAIVAVSISIAFLAPYLSVRAATGAQLSMPSSPVPVYVEHERRSHVGDAEVVGLGLSQRLIVSSALVAGESRGELTYVVGRELAHINHGDPLRLAIYEALFVIFGAALAVFVADRIGFRRDDDEVSRLALVAALLGVVYLIAAPAHNAIVRGMTARADAEALARADRASAVREIVRETDQRMDEVCPDVVARVYLESYPGAGERVSSVNGVASGCP